MTTVISCRTCGTVLRENAKFCDECGAPVAASADKAAYKQVTVLFADVVRSMDIAVTLDIERLREVMTALVERLAAVARRYGGTAEHTGDGVMAIFGAPIALEDHGVRGCLAALAMQEETQRIAAEVKDRDDVDLWIRVGLNSGRVIAGDLGSRSLGYAATGETVGFAQRMESAAPPGGVLLSESTAVLVERVAEMAEPEWVRVKGADRPVRVRRLISMGSPNGVFSGRVEPNLVGRRREIAALDALVNRTGEGRGGVVNVVGPAGIGKSRVAREVATLAASRGFSVVWSFCESHARDVPFNAVTRLLRTATGVTGLDDDSARAHLRRGLPDADPEDLLLLDELLGIADPTLPPPQIESDARRRRLTALIQSSSLARADATLFIIEDAHWIDPTSETMLADLFSIVPSTSSMVVVTSRPEYGGALGRMPRGQTITLAPLSDSEMSLLVRSLTGPDPSVGELSSIIAGRAAGNAFFAEEMVRELAQRGILTGEHGHYACQSAVADVQVPATVQAAIEARIDCLGASAKPTLSAASVIGIRFEADLLSELGVDPVFDELLEAELIDQVRLTPGAEYAFRHPLIRAVAYESQLKSDRAESHRRLAKALQTHANSADENAALIAEHLEAGGEPADAYSWHMRAAAWSSTRDPGAARVSWERARRIADAFPADHPDQLSMRIAPRTMLCATDFQAREVQDSGRRFAELRGLCEAAGDKVSMAIATTGLATELMYTGRSREGSQLVSEQMVLLESIGVPELTLPLSIIAFVNWGDAGEFAEMLRWSHVVVEMSEGDPLRGAGFGVGSPLAQALAARGVARWFLGRPYWRHDLDDAVEMSTGRDPTTVAFVTAWVYGMAIGHGVLRASDSAVRAGEKAVAAAQRGSNDHALLLAKFALGGTLLHRDSAGDRQRGMAVMLDVNEMLHDHGPALIPVTKLLIARERARQGDCDEAIAVMRDAAEDLHRAQQFGWSVFSADLLAEALLERGAPSDVTEAEATVDRLAALPSAQAWAIRDVTLLRLRALLANARGDDIVYRQMVGRYRLTAKSLGFEGHIAWAEGMAAELV